MKSGDTAEPLPGLHPGYGPAQPGTFELGEGFLKVFLAIKWTEYRQLMGEVGEQDWRWCLSHA